MSNHRSDILPDALYRAHSGISGEPLPGWRSNLERAWKLWNLAQETITDGASLMKHQMDEVNCTRSLELKTGFVLTNNKAYKRYTLLLIVLFAVVFALSSFLTGC